MLGLVSYLRKVSWLLAWCVAIILIRKLPSTDPDYQTALTFSVVGWVLSLIDVVFAMFTWDK